jgi:hypothetical protein
LRTTPERVIWPVHPLTVARELLDRVAVSPAAEAAPAAQDSRSRPAGADAASTGPLVDGVLLDEQRLDADVKGSCEQSDGDDGSPRVRADLREWGWKVTKKTV